MDTKLESATAAKNVEIEIAESNAEEADGRPDVDGPTVWPVGCVEARTLATEEASTGREASPLKELASVIICVTELLP